MMAITPMEISVPPCVKLNQPVLAAADLLVVAVAAAVDEIGL
jgi:hypothetical protein